MGGGGGGLKLAVHQKLRTALLLFFFVCFFEEKVPILNFRTCDFFCVFHLRRRHAGLGGRGGAGGGSVNIVRFRASHLHPVENSFYSRPVSRTVGPLLSCTRAQNILLANVTPGFHLCVRPSVCLSVRVRVCV